MDTALVGYLPDSGKSEEACWGVVGCGLLVRRLSGVLRLRQ